MGLPRHHEIEKYQQSTSNEHALFDISEGKAGIDRLILEMRAEQLRKDRVESESQL